MTKTLNTTRKRGDKIMVGDSTIEFVECDRGRVRVRVVHDETIKVQVKISDTKPLQSAKAVV